MTIAILTSETQNQMKRDDLFLIEALRHTGIPSEHVVWDDNQVDWSRYQMAIIRSTWGYYEKDKYPRFLQTLQNIQNRGIHLLNPFSTVLWNSSKNYLKDLAKEGIRIVDTLWIKGKDLPHLSDLLEKKGWKDCVIKPLISGGGYQTVRFNNQDLSKLQSVFMDAEQPLMVQPFMEKIVTEGEWAFIFFGDEYSHCVLKKPAPQNFLVQKKYGGTIETPKPQSWMIDEAYKILKSAKQKDLLYARIDVLSQDHSLVVMEVEMIEPVLYLEYGPGVGQKLAAKIQTLI